MSPLRPTLNMDSLQQQISKLFVLLQSLKEYNTPRSPHSACNIYLHTYIRLLLFGSEIAGFTYNMIQCDKMSKNINSSTGSIKHH